LNEKENYDGIQTRLKLLMTETRKKQEKTGKEKLDKEEDDYLLKSF
jgi:hypothetical protein